MSEIPVRETETGEWVVEPPGGDQYAFPSEGQAKAFANGFHIVHDSKASVDLVRDALERLQDNGLEGIGLAGKLRRKLRPPVTVGPSW